MLTPVLDGRARYAWASILATWRSGYAAACKAVYTGSIPVVASTKHPINTGFVALLLKPPRVKGPEKVPR